MAATEPYVRNQLSIPLAEALSRLQADHQYQQDFCAHFRQIQGHYLGDPFLPGEKQHHLCRRMTAADYQ